jgi:hypothetical protein
VDAAKKQKVNFHEMKSAELHAMVETGKDQEAIAYLKTYQPSNIFSLNKGDMNILQLAILHNSLPLVKYLLEDHKVLSCIARAVRNIHTSIIVNCSQSNHWCFENANFEIFEYLWGNHQNLLSEEDVLALMDVFGQGKEQHLEHMINSFHKFSDFQIQQRTQIKQKFQQLL